MKEIIKKLPYLKRLYTQLAHYQSKSSDLKKELEALKKELEIYKTWVPARHFYSPIPDTDVLQKKENKIFPLVLPSSLPEIELNDKSHLDLLEGFNLFYKSIPFQDEKKSPFRYYFNNDYFLYADAIVLYCFLRYLTPQRIIEVGSGYSTCVMLDTNEHFLNGEAAISCIEPYPDRLFSLIKEGDTDLFHLIQSNLEDVSLDYFRSLEAGDILFIDSTHVAKTGSDVNYYLFEVLPLLKSGVYIHIHDIFYPFEYPKSWVYEGRAWNELYMIRAFLMYNRNYEIAFFNDYAGYKFKDLILKEMPLYMKNTGGSLWLRKVS